MPDEMFFSADRKSLRRGKRKSPRTEVCRPCLVWAKDDPDSKFRGVVMDVSPHGMCVRMVEILPTGTPIMLQMMRDDEYQEALSVPVEGEVMRYESGVGGLTDHGFKVLHKAFKRAAPSPISAPPRVSSRPITRTRMYSIDRTVGNRLRNRQGRGR